MVWGVSDINFARIIDVYRLHLYHIHSGWKCESNDAKLYYYLFKYTEHLLRVTHCVAVKPDFSWIMSFQGHPVDCRKCSILRPLSDTVQSGTCLFHIMCIHHSKLSVADSVILSPSSTPAKCV